MPNTALIDRARTRVPLLMQVHGWPDDTLTMTSETGGEPLEDGLPATDHVRRGQDQVTLVGWVSDFDGIDRTHEAIAELRRLHREGTPLEVITEDATHPEMVIRRAQVVKNGRGRELRLDLEEIIRVSVGRAAGVDARDHQRPGAGARRGDRARAGACHAHGWPGVDRMIQ